MRDSRLLAALLAPLIALLVLSASVAVPILCRPFYYAHIGAMNLPARTGLSQAEIRAAYDQVLDYCTGRTEDFSAGVLPFSASGAEHFADVRGLFLLDLGVLAGSAAALAAVMAVARRRRLRPRRLLGRGPGFWAALGLGAAFLAVGGLAALDFERAFTVFHTLFFPGKDNWMFDWRTDPVILILPQDFFRNCALLVLILLLVWCGALIGADLRRGRKGK